MSMCKKISQVAEHTKEGEGKRVKEREEDGERGNTYSC